MTVRLDPFIFPSDTSLRFVILNTFVLGWTVVLAASIASEVVVDQETQASTIACGERLFTTLGMFHMIRMGLDELLPEGRFADCLASFPEVARFTIVNLLIVMAVAATAYYTHHLWIIRRHRLVPLPAEAMPELTVTLEELRHRAGLARPVRFFWNPLASHGVRAFGGPRHSCVALSGGLVAEFAHDRRRFAAIVLHELAHHRNRDVAKTFWALAIFWSFLFAVVAPYAVTEALRISRTWDIASGVWGSVRLALIVGIVYLTRNALLRARELYADARVAGWIPPAAVLEAMHERAAAMDRQRWPPAVADVHPSLRQRRRALEQPSSLLQASGWDAFGTGLAAAAAIVPGAFALILVLVVLLDIEGLLSALERVPLALAFASLALLFLPGAVAAGAVALMVWRTHLAKRLLAGPKARVARLALALALGSTLGGSLIFPFDHLLLAGHVGGALAATEFGRVAGIVAVIIFFGTLSLVFYAFLAWVRAAADAWLLPMLGTVRPWRLAAGLVTIGSLALGSAFAILGFGHLALLTSLPFLPSAEHLPPVIAAVGLAVLGAILVNPLTLLALVVAIVLPLAATRWERAGTLTSRPGWIDAGASASPLPLPRWRPFRPGLAFAIGLVAGVLFCVVTPLAVRTGLLAAPQLPGGALNFVTMTLAGYIGQLILPQWMASLVAYVAPLAAWNPLVVYIAPAVLLQAVVAGATAAAISRHPILHGLMAGLVSGTLATVALLLVPWLSGSPEIRLDPWFMLAIVFYPGILFGWALAGISAALARRHDNSSLSRPQAAGPA